MTIEEIRQLKKELGYSNAQLSDESGVSLGTVNKALSGASAHPRYETMMAMWKVLQKRKKELTEVVRDVEYKYNHAPADSIVREEAVVYGIPSDKGPGDFTIEDYLNLPDDHRVELIDGVFYDMVAPSLEHQRLIFSIGNQIGSYINSKGGPCEAFVAPVDVVPDPKDDKTILQPDILIVCDPNKCTKERIIGAPDFIIEITSPSTRRKDMLTKLSKYTQAGVREYWIVDLQNEKVMVYSDEMKEFVKIYPLEGKIPVEIYNGELEIDFDQVRR